MDDTNHHTHDQRINIFILENPRKWFERRDEILKVLVRASNPELPDFLKPEFSFSVDPVCGWIRFSIDNDLWHDTPKRALPPDAQSAVRAAQEFIRRLREACGQKEYLKLQIPPLLPDERFSRIAPVGVTPVFHFRHAWVDHWLCRFEVRVRPFADERTDVRVFGGEIDIRIGQRGKATGFVSRWRPALLEQPQAVHMFPPIEGKEHSHSSTNETAPELIYELSGENCPQTFMTPYYLSIAGHHGGMTPASSHSLIVSLGFAKRQDARTYVVPQVFGGSGDYAFNWAYWRPDALFEEGLVGLGAQEFIELPPGVYNVVLHVKDNRTGVVQMHESMTFTSRTAEEFTKPELAS